MSLVRSLADQARTQFADSWYKQSPNADLFVLAYVNVAWAAGIAFLPHSMEASKSLRDFYGASPLLISSPWWTAALGNIIGHLYRLMWLRFSAASLSAAIWFYEVFKLGAVTHWEAPGEIVFTLYVFISFRVMFSIVSRGALWRPT